MTTQQKILAYICAGLFFVGAILLSWLISGNRSYHKGWNDAMESVVPDTVWHTDTITYEKPVEVEKWKDRIVYVPITQTDTIHQHDTTYIALQFERKVYQDTTYRAVVSGFQPSLDEITVYPKTAYITKVKTEYKYPQFILSPALNVEILPRSVFAGAGIVADYWTGRFQISAEVGYGINNILSAPIEKSDIETESKILGSNVGFYGKLGAKFNIIRK